MEDWVRIEAKKRILKALATEPLSPRQMCGRKEMVRPFENLAEMIFELLTEGKIVVAKIDIAYLPEIKGGPNGILEAFFGITK